jgi:RNA polymerase nonessential primary-like sigma factor
MFITTILHKTVLRGISLLLTGALLLLSVPANAISLSKQNVDNLAAPLATAPMCVVVPGVVDELSFHDKKLSGKEISYYDLRNSFKTRLFATKSHTVLPDQSDISFIINEIAENSYDAILDKIDKLDINPADYDGRVVLKVYNDEQELVISCVDNGLTVEFDIFGTPESRARDPRRHFGGGHGAQKVMKKKLYGMSGKIKYIPLNDGTKVEIRIPRKSLPTKKYFSNNQRIVITDEATVARQMARVRLNMISQAVTLSRVVYAEKDDPILVESDSKLLTHGKILVSPRLKNNPLKQLRAIFHEEIEAVMQIISRQAPLKYSGMREMILSDAAIRRAYYQTFPKNKAPDLEDNLLVNDMIATAFELLLLSEDNLITDREMTFAEGAYIRAIRPAIKATKHNYFTSIFWDQYTREMEIRTAMASGQNFYEVASTSSTEKESPKDKTGSSQKTINAVDLSQDPRVIEIAKDLQTSGLQNFTEIYGDNIPRKIKSGGGFVGLFRHKNGLEIIQRRNYEEYVKKFFTLKRPWFCPVFDPEIGIDENMLFELNLETMGYQTFMTFCDGKYQREGTRVPFKKEQAKLITDTIRHAITKTFKEGEEKSDHGHLHSENILLKLGESGDLEDVKIIDWKCIFKENLPPDLKAFINGERENLRGANFMGAGLGREGDIEGYNFQKQDMTESILKSSAANWANFSDTILRGANLSYFMTMGALFISSDLREVNLQDSYLDWSDFTNADLRGSNFTRATLTNVILTYAKLYGANFTDANLRGIDLTNVDLSQAILLDTIFDIKQAHFFESQGYYVRREKYRCLVTSSEMSKEYAQINVKSESSETRKSLGAAVRGFTKEFDDPKKDNIEKIIAKLDFQNDSKKQAQLNLDILQTLAELPDENKTVDLALKVVEFMGYKGNHEKSILQAGKHFFETIPEEFLFDFSTAQTVTKIENNEFDPWSLYQRDISGYPMLTRLGEITLGVRIQFGDVAARNKFIEANLRLVFHIITKKFSERGTPTRDLLSSGYEGLIKAVKTFKPRLKTKFSTYGSLLIKQAIQDHLRTEPNQVRIPLVKQDRIRIFKEKCLSAGLNPADKSISSDKIASAIDENVARVLVLRNEMFTLISLDAPPASGDPYYNDSIEEIIGKQKDFVYLDEVRDVLSKVLTKLRIKWRKNYDRNKEILNWRLFEPLKTGSKIPTLKVCSKHFNLKGERIRQIEQEGREALVLALNDIDMPAEYFAEGLRELYEKSLNAPKSLGAAARGFTKEVNVLEDEDVSTSSMAKDEVLRREKLRSRVSETDKLLNSFKDACNTLWNSSDEGYSFSALSAEMVLSSRQKEGESLILYADDILSSTMAVDLEYAMKEILSSHSTLKNGKIIIFAKNEAAGEIINSMIKKTSLDVETFIITKAKLKNTKNVTGSQADEMNALVNFARTKGATDILALIKGPSQQPEDLTDICEELEIPVLMIGHEEGLYSFARAVARAANIKDSNGAEGWFIVLRPISPISEDIKAMHQEYLSALQALMSA